MTRQEVVTRSPNAKKAGVVRPRPVEGSSRKVLTDALNTGKYQFYQIGGVWVYGLRGRANGSKARND